MKVGFTGTREGMTNVQREAVAEFLNARRPMEIHHGDCKGADSEFQDSALLLSTPPYIVIHPPDNPKLRAFRKANSIRIVKPYLARNKDIVDESDHLLAAPKTFTEEQRSGTWSTIRYAQKMGKPVTIVWPDGSVD